jgi:protein-ribulosamine 3-kinase
MTPALLAAIGAALAANGEGPITFAEVRPLGSGFDARWQLAVNGVDNGTGHDRRFFVKTARGAGERYAAEADGLTALARCTAFVVPRVLARGTAGDTDFLVLEWLDLADDGDDARLGEALAALHAIDCPRYGWRRDNFIGTTPQANGCEKDWNWARFFAEQRLRPQLALAAQDGHAALAEAGLALLEKLPDRLAGHAPRPALLHGDLWRGNVGFVAGRPALFDPAVHAGDPECDLAMAMLFGGFSRRFIDAYGAGRRDEGHDWRLRLYQLYHQLNHTHLFGGAYVTQAGATIRALG